MIEKIFQGFIEWIYGMILEFWEYFSSTLLDVLSVDFAYLQARIPILPTIQQAMLAVGWALLLGNLVFQATRGMVSGLGFEGEDPKLLFTRTFVFSFLLLASPQICGMCLNMTSTVIGIMEIPQVVKISLVDATAFDGLPCAWLVAIICGVIVMFQSFKLIFALVERYFILAVLTICAPLAFGVGGSKNTTDIFKGWCRMYGSMCLLMVLNVVFVKMLLSVLASAPEGVEVLLWVVLVISIVKVARKADDIITRMGLNPAITSNQGRGIASMLTYAIARTVMQQVIKTAKLHPSGPKFSFNTGWSNTASGRATTATGPTYPGQKQLGYISSVPGQPSQHENEIGLVPSPGPKDATTAAEGGESAKRSSTTAGKHTVSGYTTSSVSRDSRKTAVPPGTRRTSARGKGSEPIRSGVGEMGPASTQGKRPDTMGRNSTESSGVKRPSGQISAIPLGPAGKQPKDKERSGQVLQPPGMAGRPVKGVERPGQAVQAPGTAEKGVQKAPGSVPQGQNTVPGAAGTPKAGGSVKLTQATTQAVHNDHSVSASQSKEQSSSKVGGSQITSSVTAKGDGVNKPVGTRSTRRPADAVNAGKERRTHTSSSVSERKAETSHIGTAETASPGASRQSTRVTKVEGQSGQPKATQPVQSTAPPSARQGARPGSPERSPSQKTEVSSVRPGAAGMGATMPMRQTSRASRQGRNATSPVTQQVVQPQQVPSARQEGRPDSQAKPVVSKPSAPGVRPGTAGTASKSSPETRKPKTAQSRPSGTKGKTILKGNQVKPTGGKSKAKKGRSSKVHKSPPGGDDDV